MFKRYSLIPFGIFLLLLLSCGDQIAGNGSQTGNPAIMGKLVSIDGTPACNATVYLLLRDTLYQLFREQMPDTVAVVRTKCDGLFTIDSIDTGMYVIEGTDGDNNVTFIDSIHVQCLDSTIVLFPATLKPAGAIRGNVVLSEGGDPQKVFVIIRELDNITTVNSDGEYKFYSIPEGHYSIRVIPTIDNYGVFDTANIRIYSGDTTVIDPARLMFSGIPTVKNISMYYDTLHQQVTLSWTRPSAPYIKSFNIYRRELSPVMTLTKQLNFYPVTDTFFIDSLCEQNKSYEYRITTVDSNTNEGTKSSGISALIARYSIRPENVIMSYDTLRQKVTLHWSNPDKSIINSFNVYKRNVRLNEKFWTPYNNSPVCDTFFIDSMYLLCPTIEDECDDSQGFKSPAYEYCVTAIIRGVREGTMSDTIPVYLYTNWLKPTNVSYTYDTLAQLVHLRWTKPDMTILRGFSVLRRNISSNEPFYSKISTVNTSDTLFTDSTAIQNQAYEYRIASTIKGDRAEIKSDGINVQISASFSEDTAIFKNYSEKLHFPNDIVISQNSDIFIVNQGTSSILCFDSVLNFRKQIGTGVLDYPLKVCIDEKGQIFVANYDRQRDFSSIIVFDESGVVVDTILESIVVNDLDVKGNHLYTISDGRIISIHSYDGTIQRKWQISGQYSSQTIISGDSNKIYVNTGFLFPDNNNVISYDSLGNKKVLFTFPYYPRSLAFDTTKNLLYVLCNNGTQGSILQVFDSKNTAVARYKIKSTDPNISIAVQKNGTVFLTFKNDGKILKLKPLF